MSILTTTQSTPSAERMGGRRRSSANKPVPKRRPKLDKIFKCPVCSHDGCMVNFNKQEKGMMEAVISCKVCKESHKYRKRVTFLTEAIDVFSDWIDARDSYKGKTSASASASAAAGGVKRSLSLNSSASARSSKSASATASLKKRTEEDEDDSFLDNPVLKRKKGAEEGEKEEEQEDAAAVDKGDEEENEEEEEEESESSSEDDDE